MATHQRLLQVPLDDVLGITAARSALAVWKGRQHTFRSANDRADVGVECGCNCLAVRLDLAEVVLDCGIKRSGSLG